MKLIERFNEFWKDMDMTLEGEWNHGFGDEDDKLADEIRLTIKDAEKWNNLYEFYKKWKKAGTDETFCDVFEEMNGGITELEKILEGME